MPFFIIVGLIFLSPFLGKGFALTALILAGALLGAPLFVLIGIATIACFALFSGFREVEQLSVIMEAIRSLVDTPLLIAIPLFIMSGAVMSKGEISKRLIDFSQALVGWIPGGMAMSSVIACMLFAAISGSSPATVVAIGSMMGPALITAGYSDKFSHGLVTASGSLGILIPPSIPMIIYPIVNQHASIEVERLFAAGFGPGLVMGSILIGFSFYHGIVDKVDTQSFAFKRLVGATRDGFWALMFPIIILGGIYGGIFNAVEAAAVSVVYAVIVEVYLHRALEPKDIPKIFQETGIFLGSLLVILVMALALNEFLEQENVPAHMVDWIRGKNLDKWQFLIMMNIMLLIVGMAMDILSAMFVFVPLLAPVAMSMGVDPIHFGIIFIVNLEIGYLTPPVGLNLFVAVTLFDRPLGHIIKAVSPFIVLMLIGLGLITAFPQLSIGLGNKIMGVEDAPASQGTLDADGEEEAGSSGAMPTMEEMMREMERAEDSEDDEDSDDSGNTGGAMPTTDDMMKEAEAN